MILTPSMKAHVGMGASEERVKAEASVVEMFVTSVLSRGFTVSVHNGDEWLCKQSNTPEVIMGNIMTTDEDIVQVYTASGGLIGHAQFVYSNLPSEVLADHSLRLTEYLVPVEALIQSLENRGM